MRRSFPLNHLKRHQVWKKWDLWYKASLQGWDGVIPGLWYQTEICQRLLKQGRAFIEIPEQQFIDLVDYQPADESKWLSLSWFAKASPAAPDVPSLLLVASPTQHCYSASADALCKVYPDRASIRSQACSVTPAPEFPSAPSTSVSPGYRVNNTASIKFINHNLHRLSQEQANSFLLKLYQSAFFFFLSSEQLSLTWQNRLQYETDDRKRDYDYYIMHTARIVFSHCFLVKLSATFVYNWMLN